MFLNSIYSLNILVDVLISTVTGALQQSAHPHLLWAPVYRTAHDSPAESSLDVIIVVFSLPTDNARATPSPPLPFRSFFLEPPAVLATHIRSHIHLYVAHMCVAPSAGFLPTLKASLAQQFPSLSAAFALSLTLLCRT